MLQMLSSLTMTAPTQTSQVISNRQKAYLEAMDIGVWVLRDTDTLQARGLEAVATESIAAEISSPGAEPVQTVPVVVTPSRNTPTLKLGPGRGGVLLVCGADTDSASRLASDISRALGSVPVWAWPHTDANAIKLDNAVEENLFTTVAIFGDELAAQFFEGNIPASLNAANVVMLPSMEDIQNRPDARRQLWAAFCRSGIVSTV